MGCSPVPWLKRVPVLHACATAWRVHVVCAPMPDPRLLVGPGSSMAAEGHRAFLSKVPVVGSAGASVRGRRLATEPDAVP